MFNETPFWHQIFCFIKLLVDVLPVAGLHLLWLVPTIRKKRGGEAHCQVMSMIIPHG